MDIRDFETVGAWYDASKREGFSIPLPMCHALRKLMEKYHISLPQAYQMLVKEEKVFLEGKFYIFDLTGGNL